MEVTNTSLNVLLFLFVAIFFVSFGLVTYLAYIQNNEPLLIASVLSMIGMVFLIMFVVKTEMFLERDTGSTDKFGIWNALKGMNMGGISSTRRMGGGILRGRRGIRRGIIR